MYVAHLKLELSLHTKKKSSSSLTSKLILKKKERIIQSKIIPISYLYGWILMEFQSNITAYIYFSIREFKWILRTSILQKQLFSRLNNVLTQYTINISSVYFFLN